MWCAQQNKERHVALLNSRNPGKNPQWCWQRFSVLEWEAGARYGWDLQHHWAQVTQSWMTDVCDKAFYTVITLSPLRPLTVTRCLVEAKTAQGVLTLRTWKSLASLHRSQNLGSNRCSTVSLLNMVTTLHMICGRNILWSEVTSVYTFNRKQLQISIDQLLSLTQKRTIKND